MVAQRLEPREGSRVVLLWPMARGRWGRLCDLTLLLGELDALGRPCGFSIGQDADIRHKIVLERVIR